MKKAFIYFIFLLLFSNLKSQETGDYIITWKNDTIKCFFPENPKSEGIKGAKRFFNGHEKFVVVFPNDSIRILNAGDVKAYFRNKHGKSFLCNGFFESKKNPLLDEVKKSKNGYLNEEWYFFQRLVKGKYASLHVIYLYEGDTTEPYYFLTKHSGYKPGMKLISSWKKAVMMLTEEENLDELKNFSKKGKTRYSNLVLEYNRLKEAANSDITP